MKKLILVITSMLLWSCSSSSKDSIEILAPIAVADNYSVIKNNTLIMSTLLDNDKQIIKETIISGLEGETERGGFVKKNTLGTYFYTPKKGFVGKESFNYTICNDKSGKHCSTAKVTVTVLETTGGNDDDGTTGDTTGGGSVNDGATVDIGSIPPPTSPETLSIPSSISSYYTGVNSNLSSKVLKTKLKEIISDYTELTYTQRHNFLYDADLDPKDKSVVILMYTSEKRASNEWHSSSNPNKTQTFNTEHVYPQSKFKGGKKTAPRTDLHHLRSCDSSINSERSNKPFIDGSGNNKIIGDSYYPGDEWKGDVARMVLYINLMHDESISKVGSLDMFLKWNKEDPVSAFEIQRNDVIYKSLQKNRNPFIDNPYLITLIYGGEPAENLWK